MQDLTREMIQICQLVVISINRGGIPMVELVDKSMFQTCHHQEVATVVIIMIAMYTLVEVR